jgi:bacteriocin biosynthesis cyclodehydratase domain-containing protein
MFNEYDIFFDKENNCFQVRTKSNIYLIEFDDEEKQTLFGELVNWVKTDAQPVDKTVKHLKKKYPEEKVIEVMATLTEFGFLPHEAGYARQNGNGQANGKENSNQAGSDAKTAAAWENTARQIAEEKTVLLCGDGPLAEELNVVLHDSKFKQVKQLSIAGLCKTGDFSTLPGLLEKFDFVVADGTAWNPLFLEELNRQALAMNKPWMHMGGVEGRYLKTGPIFYGRETGCYNCLSSRIKSVHEHGKYLASYESYLRNGRQNAQPDALPYAPLYYKIVASLTAMEITRFFEHWNVPVTWRSFVAIDVITYEFSRHQLLKSPFCDVCKPELAYNPAPWLESVSLK